MRVIVVLSQTSAFTLQRQVCVVPTPKLRDKIRRIMFVSKNTEGGGFTSNLTKAEIVSRTLERLL